MSGRADADLMSDYWLVKAHVNALSTEQRAHLALGPMTGGVACRVCAVLKHAGWPAESDDPAADWLVRWHRSNAIRCMVIYALADSGPAPASVVPRPDEKDAKAERERDEVTSAYSKLLRDLHSALTPFDSTFVQPEEYVRRARNLVAAEAERDELREAAAEGEYLIDNLAHGVAQMEELAGHAYDWRAVAQALILRPSTAKKVVAARAALARESSPAGEGDN